MKQEIINTKSYVSVPTSEHSHAIVSDHIDKCKELNTEVKITSTTFLLCTGSQNCTKSHIKRVSFLTLDLALPANISILTMCLAKIKDHVELYCDKAYQNSGINLFWSINNSTEVLGNFKTIDV